MKYIIAILLLVILVLVYSNYENMGLQDVLKEQTKKQGKLPSISVSNEEITVRNRLAQLQESQKSEVQKKVNHPGISEHMDDSMGEKGEDALEVALKGGSGWSVFYG